MRRMSVKSPRGLFDKALDHDGESFILAVRGLITSYPQPVLPAFCF